MNSLIEGAGKDNNERESFDSVEISDEEKWSKQNTMKAMQVRRANRKTTNVGKSDKVVP